MVFNFFFFFGVLVDCLIFVDIINVNKFYDGVINGSWILYLCVIGYIGSFNEFMIYCVNGVWIMIVMICIGWCCNIVIVCVWFYIKKKLYYVIIEWW